MIDLTLWTARIGFAAVLAIAPLSAVQAAPQPLPLSTISATGAYLAGREALKDLDTSAAATNFLDAARADWNNPDLVGSALEAMIANGKVGDAVDVGNHLLELQPNNLLGHLYLGTVALRERRYDSAVRQFDAVKSNTFYGITAAILHAWADVGNGQYAKAQKVLDGISSNGLEDFLLFHRALMADVAGEHKAALGMLEQAYKNQPDDSRLVEAYVRALANAARFKEAQKVLGEYAGKGWNGPFVAQLQEAIKDGRRPGLLAPSVQAGAAEMYYGIGKALSQDGSSTLAAEYFNLGLYLNPNADQTTMALASVYEKAKQFDHANALYDGLSRDSVYKNAAMVRAAVNLSEMDNRKEAIRRLHNIVAVRPNDFDAVVALGNQLRFDKQFAKAAAEYSRALLLAGGEQDANWSLYYARGIAYERDGQWPKAEADFLVALKLNPGQPQVLNYLGYSWVDKGIHLDRALKMIKEAIDWDPSDGYVVDSLGWAYYRLGRIDEAVHTLEQAVQLRPNDAEINDHLGDAYWKAGRTREARYQWAIAADLDKTGDVRKRAEAKLKDGLSAANESDERSAEPQPEPAPASE